MINEPVADHCSASWQLVNIGDMVLATVTVWLQVFLLPQVSLTSHVRVMSAGQAPLVTVLRMVSAMFVQQASTMFAGGSNVHSLPHSTVLSLEQDIVMHVTVSQHWVSETLSICAPPWVAAVPSEK